MAYSTAKYSGGHMRYVLAWVVRRTVSVMVKRSSLADDLGG
jgi:hypothetical protein